MNECLGREIAAYSYRMYLHKVHYKPTTLEGKIRFRSRLGADAEEGKCHSTHFHLCLCLSFMHQSSLTMFYSGLRFAEIRNNDFGKKKYYAVRDTVTVFGMQKILL